MTENTQTIAVKKKNFFSKWLGVYFSPSETYTSLNEKPDWLIPLLLLALFTVIMVFLMAPYLKEAQIEAMMDRGLSQNEAYDRIEKIPSIFQYLSPIFGGISAFIVSFIIAGAFYIVFNFILGGESSYKKVLSIYSYTALAVTFIGMLIKTPLILAKHSVKVQTSLAAFLSPDMEKQFFYKLLAKFDIFIIWELILLMIGFGVIYRFSRGKSATGVFSLWGAYVIVSLILGGIFSRLGR